MTHSNEQSVAILHRKEFDRLIPSRHVAVRSLRQSEVGEAAEFAKRQLPGLKLDNLERVRAILTHDRASIQRFGRAGEIVGLYAMLFLNDRGFDALLGGKFEGAHPEFDHLAQADSKPAAIYSWLVACPGRAAAGIGNVSAMLQGKRFRDVDLYACPATHDGLRILRGTGHVPVTSDPRGLHCYVRIRNRNSIHVRAA